METPVAKVLVGTLVLATAGIFWLIRERGIRWNTWWAEWTTDILGLPEPLWSPEKVTRVLWFVNVAGLTVFGLVLLAVGISEMSGR